MALHPEIQKKAQAEIDTVVGNDRLPSLSDRGSLPYTEAIVCELLRWNPVTPLGVPHRVSDDNAYKGYLIPKHSVVIPNAWYVGTFVMNTVSHSFDKGVSCMTRRLSLSP